MQDKRRRVDELDRIIMESLKDRFELTRQIIAEKMKKGLPLYDPIREAEILQRAENHGPAIGELYQYLLELSKQDGAKDECRLNHY